jgi:DNA-binding NarL/FixJ family response regulator
MVGSVDDGSSALRVVAEQHPALVVLDADVLGVEVRRGLEDIRAGWPQVRCIVLASDAQQRQAAEAAGADQVLLKGFLAAELFKAVELLLAADGENQRGAFDSADQV